MKKIKIFDLGSNTFRQTRNLIERFCAEGEVVEVHTFEAQKGLALKNLSQLKIDYPSIDFTHNNVAVWNEDTNLIFYESKKWGRNYKGGSSLIKHDGSEENNTYEYDEGITVPAIDFAKYLSLHTDQSTYNFIKMDIEGAEYTVLPHLINSNCIKNLNELACEYHISMFRKDKQLKEKLQAIRYDIQKFLKNSNIKTIEWF